MKTCSHCKSEKPESCFWRAARGKNGIDWWCIECRKNFAAKHRERYKLGIKLPGGRPARKVDEGKRWCSGCQLPKDTDQFTGIERRCRDCKKYDHIGRKYGLSRQEYKKLREEAGGLCAVCGKREPRYVDHCHSTGLARGLLCPRCNTLIGLLEGEMDNIIPAISYINEWNERLTAEGNE